MGGESVNIKVVCRVRPLNNIEEKKKEEFSLEFPNENQIKTKVYPKKFTFDDVYKPEATQKEVYESAAKSIVTDVLDGYNGTIFAYGQTSSGKTFTMEGELGDKENRGIIPRIIDAIFEYIENLKVKTEVQIKIAYFEIYNEKVKDLLDKNKMNLPVHEDKKRVPYIKGLTEEYVETPEEVMKLVNKGKKNRKTAGTKMNLHSSRSHSVFQIQVIQDNKESNKKTTGKLYMVDLAGSEKVSKSGATGERLDEAKNINKSLSCLGNVISALTENDKHHIPYRDSKLTRILQESLGGNSRTTVIICVSPAAYNQDETKSTLLFGSRAKTIKNVVSANVEFSAAEWQKKYNKLENKLAAIREMTQKLIEEARNCRKGKETPEKDQVDLDELEKLLEQEEVNDSAVPKDGDKGSNAGSGDKGGSGNTSGTGSKTEDAQSRKDTERLKKKLSKTSLATSKEKSKAQKKKKGGMDTIGEEEEKETEGDESAMSEDVPDDVLAVLKAEIDIKTQELEDEKSKLGKIADEKDDEISQLEKKVNELEENLKEKDKALKEAVKQAKKKNESFKEAEEVAEGYKERNKRMEQTVRDAHKEVQAAKSKVDEKEVEVQKLNQQMKLLTAEAQKVQEKLAEAEDELKSQYGKYGEQLEGITHEVAALGKTIVPEEKHSEFEVKDVDPKRNNETFALIRVMLAKARHYQAYEAAKNAELKKELEALKRDRNEKENGHIEQMILLNQAKEKLDELKIELKEAKQEAKTLEEKINTRNAQIVKLGRGERPSNISPDLDPDLQMLLDEHGKQIREKDKQLHVEKMKRKEMEGEKDEWQLMAETLKADKERLKKELEKKTTEMDKREEEHESEHQKMVQMELMQDASSHELATLDKIKRQMAAAFARANQNLVHNKESVAAEQIRLTSPQALPHEGELFPQTNIAQRQIEFLETNLDWVNKNNRALAKENYKLKQETIPALKEERQKFHDEVLRLKKLLKEKDKSGGDAGLSLSSGSKADGGTSGISGGGTGSATGGASTLGVENSGASTGGGKRSRNPSVSFVKSVRRSGSRPQPDKEKDKKSSSKYKSKS